MSVTSEESSDESRCSSRASAANKEHYYHYSDTDLADGDWIQTTEEEAYEILGLEKGISVVELELHISDLMFSFTDSLEGLSVEKRSAIVTIVGSLETLKDEAELAQDPHLRRVYTSLASHMGHVLAEEQRNIMNTRFPDQITRESTASHLSCYFTDRKRCHDFIGLPVLPASFSEARRILGIEENATEDDFDQRLKSALDVFDLFFPLSHRERDADNHVFQAEFRPLPLSRTFGAALLLGISRQNGLSPTSRQVVKILFTTLDHVLSKILQDTDLSSEEAQLLRDAVYRRCQEDTELLEQLMGKIKEVEETARLTREDRKAVELRVMELQDEAIKRDERMERLVEICKRYEAETRANRPPPGRIDQIEERIEKSEEDNEKIIEASFRIAEDSSLRRKEDQKEIGRLRGQVKALEKVVEQLRQEKRKKEIKQEKKGRLLFHDGYLSRTQLITFFLCVAAKSTPSITSPLIDFTIQRQAAEIIELKRQLEEEKMKSLQQQVEEVHLESPRKA
ncbi:hypothetical protein JCM3765_007533 [Sporobolomyces pararoseus]